MESFWFDTGRGGVLLDAQGRPVFGYPAGPCCCGSGSGSGEPPDPICSCIMLDAKYDLYDGSAGSCWTHTDDVPHEFELPTDRYCHETGYNSSWRRNSFYNTFIKCITGYCGDASRKCFRFGDTAAIFGSGYVWESAGPPEPNSITSQAWEIWIDTTNIGATAQFVAGHGITASGRIEIRFTNNLIGIRYRQSTASVGRQSVTFAANGCHHLIAQWNHAAAAIEYWLDGGAKQTNTFGSTPTFLGPLSNIRHFGKVNSVTGRVDLGSLVLCDTLFDDDRAADHYAAGPP